MSAKRRPFWNYDDPHDWFDVSPDQNPVGVDGLFCG